MIETLISAVIFGYAEGLLLGFFVEKEKPLITIPITIVDHKEDGSWEFFCDNYLTKIRITCFEEAIENDSSIKELADLPIGFSAERKTTKSKWIRFKKSNNKY
jgi:hypothetical protein